MSRSPVIAAVLILLAGCGVLPVSTVHDIPQYHPPMPVAYTVCPVRWEVIEVEERAMVALSYNDNVTAAICNKDIERYISQLLTVTCQYRQELKERICIGN
jgi:hypothetical protein